ncbi:aspartyl/asparaginyl beta-hydroxylase-like [Mizuhopecten yessoensis]|uniref:Aspartyl/asparaginyl beta-hydroxylase n=1 Tax=Mizuhopecten yessoensis TaxID=6573 RepID=A0A210QEV6_MIZYE|nr:aspartyl/asparaginyl beta-hydroxylase-like [Mizuhopecten yessoensis]OWF47307.1 Aspartyl/asparaginyl beta-hydroxylase [Mizuhopecten yessoensis]
MANAKKKASKNKSQKNNYHHENESNSKKRQMTPDKQKSVQNGGRKSDQHLTGSKQSNKQEPKGQPATGSKQTSKHEPKRRGSCFRQMFLLFIIASMVAVGGVIYANEEYQILIERTLEKYEVQDKLHMVYDQLKSLKSQIQESFLQLKSQIAEPESEKGERPKRDSEVKKTEDFEEEMEKRFEQPPEQPQTIDEVSQKDTMEEPEHVQDFESDNGETFEQEQFESFEPLQVDITEQVQELGEEEVLEIVEPETKKSEPGEDEVSEPVEPELVKDPEPIDPEAKKPELANVPKQEAEKFEPEVAEVAEPLESLERKPEPEELREEMQENEPENVIFTEPEPVQATESKQEAISEPEQPQISEAEQSTRPVQPELSQKEPVQFTEPEVMKIPESETNIDIEPEQPEITQPEITPFPEPELTPDIEPEEVHPTEGKQTHEPVQPKASKLDQDKFNEPEPVQATEQEKVPEPVQPEITKPEKEQINGPVQPEMIEPEPMQTFESEPEIVTNREQKHEHEGLTEKEQEESFEQSKQKQAEQHETVTEPDINKLEMKISSMLDNEEDIEEDKVEQFEEPKVEMTDEPMKKAVVQKPVMAEVAHDQQPIREEVPEPIREELVYDQQPMREETSEPIRKEVPEPIREELVHDQQPIREGDVPDPIVEMDVPEQLEEEIVSEPMEDQVVPVQVRDEVVQEPIREEDVLEPVVEVDIPEPVQVEIVSEPDKEEIVQKPVREEVVSEPKKDKVVSEPVKDKVVSEPKKDEVVQSTTGETRTGTQMSDKEVERVRKEKEKEEYPNLLITNSRDYRNRKRLDSADQLSEEGDFEGALAKYEKVIEKYPNSPRANYGKGLVLDKMAEKRKSNAFLEQAIRSLDNLLNIPDVPDRLLLLAGRRLAERQQFRGWGDKATKTWRHLVEKFPEDYNIRNQLGLSYILIGNMVAAKNAFREVISIHPTDGFAKVHLGFILKSSDLNFKEAIPLLKEGIATGEPGTEDGRFYFHLGEALQRTDITEEAYKVYHEGAAKGLFLSADQRSLYNVWTLTSRPWWTAEETGYTKHIKLLEDNWKVIRDEALNLLDANTGSFVPEEENLRETGDWKQFTLYNRGRKDKENCNKAPKTCELIDQIPDAKECRRGQVKFSMMQPGVHVWPHCGPTNCRLRAHLGLVVPPGPKIRVVNETREWQEGKVFVFDDSFEHEVWHKGDKPRMVLIVDFWHPQLDKETRLGLTPI